MDTEEAVGDQQRIQPLALSLSVKARDETRSAALWLKTNVSDEAASRFTDRLQDAIDRLRQELAEEIAISRTGKPQRAVDEAASVALSRPMWRERVETARKRARRSSTGVWYFFYFLTDADGDGSADTITIVSLQHGAAAPQFEPESEER